MGLRKHRSTPCIKVPRWSQYRLNCQSQVEVPTQRSSSLIQCLVCCGPWGHTESDTAEWLNWLNLVLRSETAHSGYPELTWTFQLLFCPETALHEVTLKTSKHLASDFSIDVSTKLQVHTCAGIYQCLNKLWKILKDSDVGLRYVYLGSFPRKTQMLGMLEKYNAEKEYQKKIPSVMLFSYKSPVKILTLSTFCIPVVRTPSFYCRECGFSPWSGELWSHRPWSEAKKEGKKTQNQISQGI